ncbi:ROK family protein [Gallibacterium sp. AGMB14963]|uniref:ROK family protein n=1 Tax=Gallibacterium faecale TaxID=3019086 RepID=UPI0022F1D1CD|nr:ROK family protein [Gallibacterium sp. AGMB14963]MDA3977476.1 ROK family protein [Gallibacterium sp. AGMB14963]
MTKQLMNSPQKLQHLGSIYRLIEQFDLISRIDLSKISGLAPASITNFTRDLIDLKLVIERTTQTPIVRGRPAVGLAISPFYWQSLCVVLNEREITIFLCELNGKTVASKTFPLQAKQYQNLANLLAENLRDFQAEFRSQVMQIFAISVVVEGQLNRQQTGIQRLGQFEIDVELQTILSDEFNLPIILSEYFPAWVFAESSLGAAISSENVIYLQVDDVINMSVSIKGKMIQGNKQQRMNIDRVCLPMLSPLSTIISEHLLPEDAQQLQHHVTYSAIYRLVNHLLPNDLEDNAQKIEYLCELANQGNQSAIDILQYVADGISYVLMNLVNIFSSDKIMINSSYLGANTIFVEHLKQKLNENLLLDQHKVDIITGHYAQNNAVVASAMVKKYLYNGDLIGSLM